MTVVSCLRVRKGGKIVQSNRKLGGVTIFQEMVSLLSDRLNLR